jgi:hypothetical protein
MAFTREVVETAAFLLKSDCIWKFLDDLETEIIILGIGVENFILKCGKINV